MHPDNPEPVERVEPEEEDEDEDNEASSGTIMHRDMIRTAVVVPLLLAVVPESNYVGSFMRLSYQSIPYLAKRMFYL